MPFVIGEMVGVYRLVEQLGQGGMATVYKAYHAALDRYVAIKVLHPALMEDPGFLARFQREARLVARLEHPNIVPIYDYADVNDRPYLVMKFISGQTLKSYLYLKEQPLSLDETRSILETVGAALEYAHQQNILHRDIKPSNVLLTTEGWIYLADFGLAKMAASTSSSTMTGDMLIGTPQYISPEQAISRPDLDGRTDIYSLGVMLYEMVVGRVPFASDTPFSIIHDHIFTPLPLPRQMNPLVPEPVERVLLKALEKDREARYQTVTEMVRAFQNALESLNANNETQYVPSPGHSKNIQGEKPSHGSIAQSEKQLKAAYLISRNGTKFPLQATNRIGRYDSTRNTSVDIDLLPLVSEKVVSRQHALIIQKNEQFFIEDLESRHGTWVNGIRISGLQVLHPDDEIRFGPSDRGVLLRFVCEYC